ncbi:putative monooxygenase [Symbiodinium microadriaticum]|uniref:Putative monooxygenase n=1 Tax=Symbiodinium microadriaticum TaxID=2951 RepID=A0A1Q9CNF7_SYMMI|nr:putative monooxygenase [Symbiodinium microadriaticum]
MALQTPLTDLLGIKHPIMLAGMNGVSHSDLAAAVSNAGGIGSIGGLTMTPKVLTKEITWLKNALADKSLPFGVDLAIPQIGGNARKTNHDYTHGHLPELIDIIVAEKVKLFICAVGVPPQWAVDKLHAGGVVIANMVGSVRNTQKALDAGVDIIIAQGTEGGGHTGDIGTMCLIPQVVDACRGRRNAFGGPVVCVAAGGIFDGRGLAAALGLGASGVWVGTRFICAEESAAPQAHKDKVIAAGSQDTLRTLVLSGRPLRLIPNDWVQSWEKDPAKIKDLCDQGIVPLTHDMKDPESDSEKRKGIFDAINSLAGQAVGGVRSVEPAQKIVEDMITQATDVLRGNALMISKL